MMSKRNRMMRVLWLMASNSHYCRIEQNPLPLLSDGVSHLYKDFGELGYVPSSPFLCSFCHIVVQVSLDDEPIKFFSICKISLCLDNSPRSQSLKTFLDYPYFLLCFHKFWCFFMKFPWNSLFCWYLSLSLHIPTNKIANFMAKLSLRQRVLEMKIGERIVVPVKEHAYTTIRSYASDLGFATGRTYSTSRNREERTYTIIRRS